MRAAIEAYDTSYHYSSLKCDLRTFFENHFEYVMKTENFKNISPETAKDLFLMLLKHKCPKCPQKCLTFMEKCVENITKPFGKEFFISGIQQVLEVIEWKYVFDEKILNSKILNDKQKIEILIKHKDYVKQNDTFSIEPQTHEELPEDELSKNNTLFFKNCQKNFFNLFQDSDSKDCEFVFADGTSLRAHKTVLAMSSKVFYAMFYGPMRQNGSIEITDIDPSIFEMLLKMMYYQKIDELINETSETLSHLYAALQKYAFDAGLDFIRPYLVCREQDLFLFYELAEMFSDSELEELCRDQLYYPYPSVNSQYFLSAKPETLIKIFTAESLNCEIYDAIQALECYIEANSYKNIDIREKISDLIDLIDFDNVEDKAVILNTNLLTDQQKLILFRNLVRKESQEIQSTAQDNAEKTESDSSDDDD